MRGTHPRRALAALIAIASLAFAAGCGSDDNSSSSSSSDTSQFNLIKDGALTVGSDIPFPPFEDGKNGNYTGFDIDLVNAIADKLGVSVVYRDTAFDTIFRDLAQGKFDMVASATTITPERQKTVDFSDPYYEAQQALMVAESSDIASTDDFGGKTIGTQDGTTGEAYVKDKTDAGSVRGFPTAPEAVNALRAGQVDAVVIDQPLAQDAIDKGAGSGLAIATEIPTDELYGLSVQKGNSALLDAVNGALQELKDDGTLADLYDQYFSIEPPNSVLEGKTATK